MNKAQLIEEAKTRKIYSKDCLKVTPSHATKTQLEKAIKSHKRAERRKMVMAAGASGIVGVGLGVGLKAGRRGKSTPPESPYLIRTKLPPTPSVPDSPDDKLLDKIIGVHLSVVKEEQARRRARIGRK